MRMSRFARDLVAVSVLPVLAACGGDAGNQPLVVGDPVTGGTAVVAVTSDFQPFNPVTSSSLLTMEVNNFMLFTPLLPEVCSGVLEPRHCEPEGRAGASAWQ